MLESLSRAMFLLASKSRSLKVRYGLQSEVLAAGQAVRVYVPLGSEWFPCFIRRPVKCLSNLRFVVNNVLYEQRGG